MSKKQKPVVKLTQAERKQIEAIQARAKSDRKRQFSAQETIGYQTMWPDGLCHVQDDVYSKMIAFQDINYMLAHEQDKMEIMRLWRGFLNTFDPSVHYQFSFVNTATSVEEFEKSVLIPPQEDDFNDIRLEYSDMLASQIAKGNNAVTRTKYLTFSLRAKNVKQARSQLERVELSAISELKHVGVPAQPVDGKERLRIMHSVLHLGSQERLDFNWNWLAPSGLSTKDFIAPSSFDFRPSNRFRMGETWSEVAMMQITAEDIDDDILTLLLSMDMNLVTSIHIQAMDQGEAIKWLKRTNTDLDRMRIEEQKKAVRSGYDMDILPANLIAFGPAVKEQIVALQKNNERMFMITFLMMHTAENSRKLNEDFREAKNIVQKKGCKLVKLDFQQEQGMNASLPLGINPVKIERNMTTRALSYLMPFMTRELFQRGQDVLYYGLNAVSNNLIMVDRKRLTAPNGMILGSTGTGKSFAAKREITNCFLVTQDDIFICDPEGEYYPLVQKLNGQVIRISPVSKDYINPLDISFDTLSPDDAMRMKSDFVLSLCELAMRKRSGMEGIDRTVIDRAIPLVYAKYIADPKPENMPILGDLHRELLKQNEVEAQKIATVLELYVSGSLNVFNHRTNVNTKNRLICYDIKDLGKQLKELGMLVVQDQVWARVSANRAKGKATRYYIDEFHLLLKEPQTANYSVEMWKRWRKWGGIPTGITQNVKDLLRSPETQNIFENCDFIYMLSQAHGDRELLAQFLGISNHQLSHVTNAMPGQGLMFYGDVIIPFVDRFPQDTKLYGIMTTRPSDIQGIHQ